MLIDDYIYRDEFNPRYMIDAKMLPIFDEMAVSKSVSEQIKQLAEQHPAGQGPHFYGVKLTPSEHIPEDTYIVSNSGKVVGIGNFRTGKFETIKHGLPNI